MKSTFSQLIVLVGILPGLVYAGNLACPDGLEEANTKEVMATSSPEVKVKATLRNEGRRWIEITRPLTQKALKLAKTQRAAAIQEGIENRCGYPQVYVGKIPGTPDKPTACVSKIVTRPADNEHMWVQVVATCKYTWTCCTSEEMPVTSVTPASAPVGKEQAASGTSANVGYTLEGPLNPNPKTSKKNAAADISASPSSTAPVNIKP